MEQHDYILRLIEEAGIFFIKILFHKESNDNKKVIETVNNAFSQLFHIDLDDLYLVDNEKFISYLCNDKNIDLANLEIVAKLLINHAECESEPEKRKEIYAKALCVMEYVDREEKVFSFDRFNLINSLKNYEENI